MAQWLLHSVAARIFPGSNPGLRFQKIKKVYMIHGWTGNPKEGWFPQIKKNLEEKGFNVAAFEMPETDTPSIEGWVGFLEENIPSEEIDEETYFIGHSIGCQTIMRFLEKLHKHKKVKGCVFVAGWFTLTKEAYEDEEDKKLMHPWTTKELDFSRVLDHCDNFLAIFSKDDPFVKLSDSEIFKEKLGAKIAITDGRGHFVAKEEPFVLKEILDFVK